MSDASVLEPAPLLWLCLFLLAGGAITTLALTLRARRTVGAVVAMQRPRAWPRKILMLAALAGALVLVLVRGDLPLALVAPCIALGALTAALSPGFKDAVCGETGVQRGWYARRFEELEEWRIAGEHLRFRLFGEWTSVPLAPHDHPRVRAKLTASNAERESRFKD